MAGVEVVDFCAENSRADRMAYHCDHTYKAHIMFYQLPLRSLLCSTQSGTENVLVQKLGSARYSYLTSFRYAAR